MRSVTYLAFMLGVLLSAENFCLGLDENKAKSKLFIELPGTCPTPDGMAIDGEGNLILACPNFADLSKPALIMKIDKNKRLTVLAECPILPKTGRACPMGIDFGPDGKLYVADNQGWLGTEKGKDEGRILCLTIEGDKLVKDEVVAYGMAHPNGVKYKNGYLYVTQSLLPKFNTQKLTSAIYRFKATDREVEVKNDASDPQILKVFTTNNMDCQYGLDGLAFDSKGNLFVGNFGDGTLHKIELRSQGSVVKETLFAKSDGMKTIDGICIDAEDNIYVADFAENRICKVTPDGHVSTVAESPNCDGSQGGLDQPGEPIIWNHKLVISCFDVVTGPGMVNQKHDKPSTLAYINIQQ